LSFVSSAANAQEQGFYIGGGVGQTHFDYPIAEQIRDAYTPPPPDGFFSFVDASLGDDSDSGYKAFAGYKLTSWLGVEMAWHDLGQVDFGFGLAVVLDGQFIPDTRTDQVSEVSLQGPSLALVGDYVFNEQTSGKLRLGVFDADIDYVQGDVGFNANSVSKDEDSDQVAMLGLSAQYQFAPQWSVRGDWDYFKDVGRRIILGEDSGGGFGVMKAINTFSVNLVYDIGP
jgi:hypothetical protein